MKKLPAAIAWRYLRSKKSHSAVSAIAAVSIIGVAVATAAIVCVLSVFNGFRDVLTERLDTLAPDIELTPAQGKVFADADSVIEAAIGIAGIELCTPTLTDNALALLGTREMPVTLKGVEPADYARVTQVRSLIKGGGRYFPDYTDGQLGALLSIGAAMQMSATATGEQLLLFAPRRIGRVNPANPAASFRQDSVIYSGLYQAQQSDYDENMVIVPIEVARGLFQYDNAEASAIEIKTSARADLESVADELRSRLGPKVIVKDRLQQQEINFRMIEIEKWVTFLLLIFILMIASFNLVSTLSMLILEKQQSLGTLHSLGMTRHNIGAIFAWESIYVAVAGGVAGMVLGVILCLLQQHFGLIKLNGDPSALIITAYPVRLAWTDQAIVAVPVAAIGLLTGWISARFARSRILTH